MGRQHGADAVRSNRVVLIGNWKASGTTPQRAVGAPQKTLFVRRVASRPSVTPPPGAVFALFPARVGSGRGAPCSTVQKKVCQNGGVAPYPVSGRNPQIVFDPSPVLGANPPPGPRSISRSGGPHFPFCWGARTPLRIGGGGFPPCIVCYFGTGQTLGTTTPPTGKLQVFARVPRAVILRRWHRTVLRVIAAGPRNGSMRGRRGSAHWRCAALLVLSEAFWGS